jgi:hypothetical protein
MVDPPATGHAEVEDHRVVSIRMDQAVFRPASKPDHLGSRQPLTEILWKGPAQVCPPRFDPLDAAALKHMGQATDGGLDFGKFGHCAGDMADDERGR